MPKLVNKTNRFSKTNRKYVVWSNSDIKFSSYGARCKQGQAVRDWGIFLYHNTAIMISKDKHIKMYNEVNLNEMRDSLATKMQ